MSEKTYIGTGKERVFPGGGSVINLRLSESDLQTLTASIRDGWTGISVRKRRAPSRTGQTHYGVLDDWQPTQSNRDGARDDGQAGGAGNELAPF